MSKSIVLEPARTGPAPADGRGVTADREGGAAKPGGPVTEGAGPRLIKRNGAAVPFDRSRIATALLKAFAATEGATSATSQATHDIVAALTERAVASLMRHAGAGHVFHIEDVQDQVELALMRDGHHKVARAYVLYRDKRAAARALAPVAASPMMMRDAAGNHVPLDLVRLRAVIREACADLPGARPDLILLEAERNLYDGITADELAEAPILAARTLIEREPAHAYVAARLLLDRIRHEVIPFVLNRPQEAIPTGPDVSYAECLPACIRTGIKAGRIDPELARFDLDRLAAAIRPERDLQFQYLGLQTLYDRYFLHVGGTRCELPQTFFMRVAMGLALNEADREARAIEFYDLLSSFAFMASTPTLFNSGTVRPQLSSCFLTTIGDDLESIFKGIRDNALLAKYSGGIGNDWTPVRGLGAHIRGTNGQSQGVVPFLKVANDTAIAVNQGGKRKGAVCAYLENWHIDVEEFLDLRKNTGDDRRRTHDMNTAIWVPDLFMQRLEADGPWTLFSPDEVPELHEIYGTEFKTAYEAAEDRARAGAIRVFREIRARDLWRRMLSMLFETGHPWITFKDPCNLRSPQQHRGVVHSSNLCTEITLNTSADEVAVCNLGSINLPAHLGPRGIDRDRLARTVGTAMRMLDNVIDINLYTIPEARNSNLRHRPVGLGIMGFQRALQMQGIAYASDAAVEFADISMEEISFQAIRASIDLAEERGRYESFDGSLWSRGILPIDSIDLVARARGGLDMDRTARLDWDGLRRRVQSVGMRNSNCLAIAPTATISNICGVSQSIEPAYRNLFVKTNMSGDFTVVNDLLVDALKERGLWDESMISDLKYHDGVLAGIARVPENLKQVFATAFEIPSEWLIRAASRRQKWLDQAQSLNLYAVVPTGRALDATYRLAWRMGLKTTYYLRSQAATGVEKSTLEGTDGRLNAVPVTPMAATATTTAPRACAIDDPECEACQ